MWYLSWATENKKKSNLTDRDKIFAANFCYFNLASINNCNDLGYLRFVQAGDYLCISCENQVSDKINEIIELRNQTNKIHENELVQVRKSTLHGRGLFAKKDIKSKEFIIEYKGEKITELERDLRGW
jgi:hypothetical protein